MSTMLKDWRKALCRSSAAWGPVLVLTPALLAADAAGPVATPAAPAATQPAEIDLPAKQYMAAQGLMEKQLYKLAGESFRDFLTQYPNHEQATNARFAMAVCFYNQRQYANAIEPLQTVLKDAKFEKRDEALSALGYCQLVAKDYASASATLGELVTKFPQSKRAESASIYRLQALLLGKKEADCATAAAEFVTKFPKSTEVPTALYFSALAQRALGHDDLAAAALARLTTDFADSKYQSDALLLYGQALETMNKLDAAIEQYRKMLASAPEARKGDAHYSLGLALYKSGAYAESATELAAVVEKFPASPYFKQARLQLGLAQLAAGKIDDSRNNLMAVVKDDPEHANDAAYGLSQCDMADKKFDSAHTTLDILARLTPPPSNIQQVLLDRAVCLVQMKKFDDAVAECAALTAKYPDAPQIPEAIYWQAYSQHRLEKYDGSHALCVRLAGMPKSAMTTPAAELDAQNLFLLAKYPDAEKAFTALQQDTKDADKLTRFALRVGQCEYFAGNYAKAATLLRPIADAAGVKPSDDALEATFLLGDALLQQGGQESAAADVLKKYLTIAKGDQHTAETRYKLALAQARSKDEAAALVTLAPLLDATTEDQWVQRGLLEVGQLNYNAKKSEAAAVALKKLLAGSPLPELVAPATYLLGWVDFDGKKYLDAAEKWKAVVDSKSVDPKIATNAAFQRAVALKEAGKTDEAVKAAFTFAADHTDKTDVARGNQLAAAALYDLAWSQRDKKDDAAAIETYRNLLLKLPTDKLAPAVRTELADLLYNDKKFAESAELLEAVIADKTAEPKVTSVATYKLGWCYEKLGKADKAAAMFTTFAATTGDDKELTPSALLEAGAAAGDQGKFDQAEKSLAELLKKFPDYKQAPVALLKLGEAQAEQLEFEASAKTYQQYLERFGKTEFAYRASFGLGWASEHLKKYDDARTEYRKVIAASNGEFAARAQFQIGETLLEEQQFEPAIKELLAVDDVYAYPKWSARALLEAGRVFEALKQPDQAKRQYNTVVSKYKDTPEAASAADRLKAL